MQIFHVFIPSRRDNGTERFSDRMVKDACALASATEVGGVVGVTVTATTTDYHGIPSCKYVAADGNYVQTDYDVEASAASARDFLNSNKHALSWSMIDQGRLRNMARCPFDSSTT